MNGKIAIDVVKQTTSSWSEHKAPRLGAALAYYTVFSLAPLLLLMVRIAAPFFGKGKSAHDTILHQINAVAGPTVANAATQMLDNAHHSQTGGLIASIIGIVLLVAGAGGIFGQLQDALNTIWEVAPKPDRPLLATVKDQVLSFGMVIGVCFLLLVSLVLTTVVGEAGKFGGGLLHLPPFILELINFAASLAVITVLFALIFKVLPDARIAWGDVWVGALITAVLFNIGKLALGFYLAKSNPGSGYGAAGALVALLLWVYYASQIILFGAEFTRVYADRFGSRVTPQEDAVSVSPERQAKEGLPDSQDLKAAAREKERRNGSHDGSHGGSHDGSANSTGNGSHNGPGSSSQNGSRSDATPAFGSAALSGFPSSDGSRDREPALAGSRGGSRRRPKSSLPPTSGDNSPDSTWTPDSGTVDSGASVGSRPEPFKNRTTPGTAKAGTVLLEPRPGPDFRRAVTFPPSQAATLPEKPADEPPFPESAPGSLGGMPRVVQQARSRRHRAILFGAAAGLAAGLLRKRPKR